MKIKTLICNHTLVFFRAIILTNSDEIKELELTKLFKDQVSVENERKKG